jgi:hypothetical protein
VQGAVKPVLIVVGLVMAHPPIQRSAIAFMRAEAIFDAPHDFALPPRPR